MGHFSSTLASVSEATRSMVAAVMKMVLTLSYDTWIKNGKSPYNDHNDWLVQVIHEKTYSLFYVFEIERD